MLTEEELYQEEMEQELTHLISTILDGMIARQIKK